MKQARGQAVVETVLGLLVAIPIVLGLLAFAELGFASLKVKEASYAAAWDLPAHQTHDLNVPPKKGRWNKLATQNTLPQRSAAFTQRYEKLQGLGSEAGNPNVMLAVQGVEVRCEQRPVDHARFVATPAELFSLAPLYTGAGSAVACRTEAKVAIVGMPRFQLSIFEEPILPDRTFSLCGLRAPGGGCGFGPPLLTDTYAFAGKVENGSCLVSASPCVNPAAGSLPVEVLTGARPWPGAFNTLKMAKVFNLPVPSPEPNASFAGSEQNFADGVNRSHGDSEWQPTPFHPDFHQVSYTKRKAGYPGVDLRDPAAGLSPP